VSIFQEAVAREAFQLAVQINAGERFGATRERQIATLLRAVLRYASAAELRQPSPEIAAIAQALAALTGEFWECLPEVADAAGGAT